jgi:hypothetical protein
MGFGPQYSHHALHGVVYGLEGPFNYCIAVNRSISVRNGAMKKSFCVRHSFRFCLLCSFLKKKEDEHGHVDHHTQRGRDALLHV